MLKSHIEFKNGKPFININGKLHYPMAYTTYFEECGDFSGFIEKGYRMFFINVSFTGLPINNSTGFSPFRTGVFDSEIPDYSEFDYHVRRITDMCPDALIFPRINISMPRKWTEANPYETVKTARGGARESLFSEVFRKDGTELLQTLVSHIRSSDYADSIAGYQICGGLTQEWMHHDFFGSYSQMGLEKFREWMQEKYRTENISLPERDDFNNGIYNDSIRRYALFCCEKVAETIEHFARELKTFINNEQIVGTFYGYSAFVCDYLSGLHRLRHIIDSPYIDFFSSPCCYDDTRRLGLDWGDMIPVDSLKIHGKTAFIECDIRTHLSTRMQDSRPNEYDETIMPVYDKDGNKTVWGGPDTPELSLSAIRKAFAHQLTKASGIWWFDMWGGWYKDDSIMSELEKMKNIADESANRNYEDYPHAETVLFIDESAYSNLARTDPLIGAVSGTRVAMGNTGLPFDICMVEDAPRIIHRYRAAVFTSPVPSEAGKYAVELCSSLNIPCLVPDRNKPHFTTQELRDRLIGFGIHCYNADNNVIYCGNGYIGIHCVCDGEAYISFPHKLTVKSLTDDSGTVYESDRICFNTKKHHTHIFEIISQE